MNEKQMNDKWVNKIIENIIKYTVLIILFITISIIYFVSFFLASAMIVYFGVGTLKFFSMF